MLHSRKIRIAWILAALVILLCAPALAEEPVTSLSDLYDGGALCRTCYGPATLETSSSYHTIICQNEGCDAYNSRYNYSHYGSCVDGSVCGICGAEYTGSYTRHVYDGGSYTGNEDYHWQPCVLCGDEEDSGWNSHRVSCQSPDACTTCGMKARDDWYMTHNGDGVYLYDADSHWQTCLDCKEKCSVSDHWGSCADKICDTCGSEIARNEDMYHSYDYDSYVACPQNPKMHGYACTREGCGYVSQNSYHYAVCTAPGVCGGCGIEYTGTEVDHDFDYDQMVVHPENPSCHGYACIREGCGYVSNNGSHYAHCGALGVCEGCGIEYTGSRVEHELNYDQMIVHPDNPARHGYACTREGCGYVEDNGSHYARCDVPGVCKNCGVEYTGTNVSHSYNYDQMIVHPDDPSCHGYACTREGCGYVEDNGSHYARCDAPGVCAGCGLEGEGFRLSHSTDWDVQPVVNPDDASEHGRYCTSTGCGKFISDGEHSAYCNAPGVCYECGAAFEGNNVSHSMDWDAPMIVNPEDENEHGRFCTREGCGYFNNYGEHQASCDAPGVCDECGYESESMRLYHSSNRDMMIANPENADEHGWYCTLKNCGTFVVDGRHRALCDAPGVCSECGAAYTGKNISHSYNYDVMSVDPENAGYHGRYCTRCGVFERWGSHYAVCDALGVCDECGVEYAGSRVEHSYNWNDYVPDPENDQMHGHICKRCGEFSQDSYHQAACDALGVCEYCGVEYTGNSVSHEWLRAYEQRENCHWRVCGKCGAMSSPEAHRANCDAPGVCSECGYEKEGMPINSHSFYDDSEYGHDANTHWRYCADCGEASYVESHAASCTEPGVCADCGAEYTGSNLSHRTDWENYVYTEEGHGHPCQDCGKVLDFERHYAECGTEGVCRACGWEGEMDRTECDWDNTIVYTDAYYHWEVCRSCGDVLRHEVHREKCYNPGVCYECGVKCEAVRVEHCESYAYSFDEDEHWSYCAYCGEEMERDEHWENCTNPGVCDVCDAEVVNSNLNHNWDGNTAYQTNATHHWRVCRDCGVIIDKEQHRTDCAKPGVCEECGVECTEADVSHEMSWQSNETHHWYACVNCGETEAWRSSHRKPCGSSANFCVECGAAYSGENTEHEWSYEYGDYYVQGAYHWRVCEICETAFDREPHHSTCIAPDVCVECGAGYTPLEEDMHSYYDRNRWEDETGHWNKCVLCGEEVFWGLHWAECSNPDVCVECGMTVSGENVEIQHDPVCTPVDATHHKYTCACGEVDETDMHYISCGDPTATCWECGMSGAVGRIEHGETDSLPATDAYSHWFTCSECGEISESESHLLDCANPGACLICGVEAEYGKLKHTAGDEWKFDANRHWHECIRCGAEMDGYTHMDIDAVDGACDRCGYTVKNVGPYLYTDEIEMLLTAVEGCNTRFIVPYNPDGSNPGAVRVTSSDASVVTAELKHEYEYSSRYLLRARKTGTAVLTLTSPNGMTKKVTVTVREPDGTLMIPANVVSVAEEAFINTDAEFICVPEGVTSIGTRAFAYCENLKVVYLPASATEISANLFSGCSDVRVYAPANSVVWNMSYSDNVSMNVIPE